MYMFKAADNSAPMQENSFALFLLMFENYSRVINVANDQGFFHIRREYKAPQPDGWNFDIDHCLLKFDEG